MNINIYEREMDEDGFVPFNADRALGQNQYASRYAAGQHGYPNLGDGLRWKNLDSSNYHDIRIHRDDLLEFHHRVEEYRGER